MATGVCCVVPVAPPVELVYNLGFLRGCKSWDFAARMVKLLLDNSADVHAKGGYYGNALQAASKGGHEQIVQLLLDKGANVNTQGGEYGNAL
ncbi:hypothetical protein FOWG_17404 [Fusarium oxysporum f. sp. lycopersici MN25]|nr:hypothetical protein FOWG_17404 [Fusarium oxysporum f. sp. lycopersici MN25]